MRVFLAGCCLLATGCMHVVQPVVLVPVTEGEARLDARAALIVPSEVRDQVDPIGTNTDLAFASGEAVAAALEQACIATFREVAIVSAAGDVPEGTEVVLEARIAGLRAAISDGELTGLELLVTAALTVKGGEPVVLVASQRSDRTARLEVLGEVLESEPRELAERAGAQVAADLRAHLAAPEPDPIAAGVAAVVKENLASVEACVTDQRDRLPSMAGKLVMKWRVLPTGHATEVQVVSKELETTPFAHCMAEAIMRWQFPAAAADSEPIVFPFDF